MAAKHKPLSTQLTPSLALAPARSQVPLGKTPFHEWAFPDGTLWTQFYRTDTGYLLRFPALADFTVSHTGLDVTATPVPGVSRQAVEHLYLNQVLPLALSRQCKLVFHASAVEINGTAVAFMGESGKGKSTLAASFATSGARFLTDDGLMVEARDGNYHVMPSHPSIRLWLDSKTALIAPDTPSAPALEFTSKARFLAGDRIAFCDSPRPLRRMYFLGDGSAPALAFQRLAPTDALIELVKHSFLLDIEEQATLAAHFDELSALASLPIYYRLDYPRRYENLAAVREAIIEHAKQESLPA
jgi:hypothetical protein